MSSIQTIISQKIRRKGLISKSTKKVKYLDVNLTKLMTSYEKPALNLGDYFGLNEFIGSSSPYKNRQLFSPKNLEKKKKLKLILKRKMGNTSQRNSEKKYRRKALKDILESNDDDYI